MMKECLVNFTPIDTWFFRESRPFGSVGANALNSVFPPPTRTLMGAVRNYIGTQYFAKNPNVNWDNLNELPVLKAVIGNEKGLGNMRPMGVFLQVQKSKNNEYYLPAPVNICQKSENNQVEYLALQLSENPYQTDIGKVYLPSLPDNARGAKPLENYWISVNAWQQILNGELGKLIQLKDEVCPLYDFMAKEYRLGIELETKNRGVKDGQLYQTTHLRLKPDVSVIMPISYDENAIKAIDERLFSQSPLLRLGGESRMAGVRFDECHQNYLPQAPKNLTTPHDNKKRFMLYFISKLSMSNGWLPNGFSQNDTGFNGQINGIDLTVISACMGKVHREGGWNQLEHKPRAITNYLPAGSAWFVEVGDDVNDEKIIQALHGKTFNANEWGEGLMLVGRVV